MYAVIPQQYSENVTMSPEEAEEYCQKEFGKSASYRMCESIPNVDPADAVSKCIIDILVSFGINMFLKNWCFYSA